MAARAGQGRRAHHRPDDANHTSDLGGSLLTPEFLPSLTGRKQRTWRPQGLFAITPEQHPSAKPGRTYSYSDANYAALGLILEMATGSRLAELIEQENTKPLGMKNPYLATNADWRAGKQHVTGYGAGRRASEEGFVRDRGPARRCRVRRPRTAQEPCRHRR
ncbi:serine hydrolase [Streptomyces sp. NPDC018045]|uniref:serine hydrolase n=1 Tax=Streptomyces sp. NPDC018045 TaxID=3365037 RepID=UPI0037A8D5DE